MSCAGMCLGEVSGPALEEGCNAVLGSAPPSLSPPEQGHPSCRQKPLPEACPNPASKNSRAGGDLNIPLPLLSCYPMARGGAGAEKTASQEKHRFLAGTVFLPTCVWPSSHQLMAGIGATRPEWVQMPVEPNQASAVCEGPELTQSLPACTNPITHLCLLQVPVLPTTNQALERHTGQLPMCPGHRHALGSDSTCPYPPTLPERSPFAANPSRPS